MLCELTCTYLSSSFLSLHARRASNKASDLRTSKRRVCATVLMENNHWPFSVHEIFPPTVAILTYS
jgi:hypothetical protein